MRVRDFAKETPNEEQPAALRKREPALDWPRYGEMRFLDATVGYSINEPNAVLRNIDLHIQPSQKVHGRWVSRPIQNTVNRSKTNQHVMVLVAKHLGAIRASS